MNLFTEDSEIEIKSDEEIEYKNFTGKLSNYLIGESMQDANRQEMLKRIYMLNLENYEPNQSNNETDYDE